MHKQQIYLVYEYICAFAGLPVLGDPVEDGVEYDQHAYRSELLAQFKYVIAYEAIARIHVGLLCKCVESSSCEELEFKCQFMCLWFRLLQ